MTTPADSDMTKAFTYGNSWYTTGGQEPITDQARAYRNTTRARRAPTYARLLLIDLDADHDRLAAVAAACRARGDERGGVYRRGAHLADLALQMVRAEHADTRPRARQRP